MFLAGHLHNYERLYPVYNGTVEQQSYINPTDTVHIIAGMAGMHLCMYAYKCICVCMCMYVCMYMLLYVGDDEGLTNSWAKYVCMYVCVCVYVLSCYSIILSLVHTYIHIHIHTYIHIYIHTVNLIGVLYAMALDSVICAYTLRIQQLCMFQLLTLKMAASLIALR